MLGIVVVAHAPLGSALLAVMTHMMGEQPAGLAVVDVYATDSLEHNHKRLEEAVATVNEGDGVVLLTDLFGATPSNVCSQLARNATQYRCAVVSGCNVPMVVRALSYRHLSIDEVTAKLVSGARNGVVATKPRPAKKTAGP